MFLQTDLKEQLKQIRERLGEHDAQLNLIYDAMGNLLDEKAANANGMIGTVWALSNNLFYKAIEHSIIT